MYALSPLCVHLINCVSSAAGRRPSDIRTPLHMCASNYVSSAATLVRCMHAVTYVSMCGEHLLLVRCTATLTWVCISSCHERERCAALVRFHQIGCRHTATCMCISYCVLSAAALVRCTHSLTLVCEYHYVSSTVERCSVHQIYARCLLCVNPIVCRALCDAHHKHAYSHLYASLIMSRALRRWSDVGIHTLSFMCASLPYIMCRAL